MYRIGIDVGGTNTDAVLMDEKNNVLSSVKSHTTLDIESGISNALKELIKNTTVDPKDISQAMLGTTQCTNAIVERKKLAKVGVIRLGYPASASVKPYAEWPEDVVKTISGNYALVHGGYEFDGSLLTAIDDEEIIDVLKNWQNKVESIAIVGIFSALHNDQELHVQELVRKVLGDKIPVSLSSSIGSIGIITRENATILNASLFKVIHQVTTGFSKSLIESGVTNAKLFLCQNDGTLMSIEFSEKYPILTIGSGPTNSIRGASYLAHKSNALVLDVGGTTSDIGVLSNGFPRQSSIAVSVGGINTNFRMPDILSIGIGGGSIVRELPNGDVTVGPDSVGYEIEDKAVVFGGNVITTTDIAVKEGLAQVGDRKLTNQIDNNLSKKALLKIQSSIEDALDKMKTSSKDIDLILVGGGSIIIPEGIKGVRQVFKYDHGNVANAIGATIAQISGEYEKIYQYDSIPRDDALNDAEKNANSQAIVAGANKNSLKMVDIEEIPLAYAPGRTTRLKIKVVGDAS
ncbi:hydantoinase subunit beta [Oenococcus oeni]|uniref:Hydantoinase subunit beta n=1 Tax=Oenococcus oeni TaxID=1247 RepID=A0A6N4A7M5_OENOE|nr:hydantoinase/oxoprolinase family protein [Oenococcus oeni]OIM20733.1 hydantoinase subunit beta [Oenococcus oeni]